MKDRLAVITGGIGDIGTVICKEFINQGARVIAADHLDAVKIKDWQEKQKSLGYIIEYVKMDVTNFESCEDAAREIEKQHGPVDILVNAAGTIKDVTFRKMTPNEWNDVVHTDLDSMFNVTKQFIDNMIKRQYGRIINIASVNGEKGQFGQTNYASAKAGVYGFTKSLAQEVARFGVTVNAISPGFVESKMVLSIPEKVRAKIIAEIPIGRLAKPDEIAWAIAFLANERSGFITGANLSINGGIYM